MRRAPGLVAGRADPLRRAVGERPRSVGWPGNSGIAGSGRGRAGTCGPVFTSRVSRAAPRRALAAAASALTARRASSGAPSSRARGRSGLMRSSEWRSLPSARSRGARPHCDPARRPAGPSSRGTRASRRPARGRPPASRRPRARARGARPRRRAPARCPARAATSPTIRAQRSWCQRLYSGSSPSDARSPSRRVGVGIGALDVVGDGRDPHRLARVGVELERPSRACARRWRACGCTSAIQAVRALEQLGHAVTGRACSTYSSPPSSAHSMSCGPPEPLLEVVAEARPARAAGPRRASARRPPRR